MTLLQWLILVVVVVAVAAGYWLLRSRASTDPWRNMDQGEAQPPAPPSATDDESTSESDGLEGDSYVVAVRTLTAEPAEDTTAGQAVSDDAADASWQAYKQPYTAPRQSAPEESGDQRAAAPVEPEVPPAPGPTLDPEPVAEPVTEREPEPETAIPDEPLAPPETDPAPAPAAAATVPRDTIEPQPRLTDDQEIFILHVLAGDEQRYDGAAIHSALADQGLRYGLENIYHRVERYGDRLLSLYGAANIVNPGTLDPAEQDQLSTPGLTLFMVAPASEAAPATLREMMETANALTLELGGQVYDDRRAVLQAQTAQYMLDRAAELDRRATLARSR